MLLVFDSAMETTGRPVNSTLKRSADGSQAYSHGAAPEVPIKQTAALPVVVIRVQLADSDLGSTPSQLLRLLDTLSDAAHARQTEFKLCMR